MYYMYYYVSSYVGVKMDFNDCLKIAVSLRQWFPTTVPRHISVPRNDYWCAAKR